MSPVILVVDDSREVRDYVADYVLRPHGYQVLLAEDGAAGLRLARESGPDLLITDMDMPAVNGLDLLKGLRAEGRDLPAILMTAQGSETLAREAVGAGFSAYIAKPFETDEMLAAITRALSEAEAARERARVQAELQQTNEALIGRLRELETLIGVGRTMTALLDLDAVLQQVVEAAVNLTGAEEGSLLLPDEETDELYMRAGKNFDDEFVRTFRLRSEDSLAGQVVRTGQPALIDESTPQKIKTAYLVHSLIYVPLKAHRQVIGVLGVDNRRARRAFGEYDRRLLLALADYAAIAIENARLYSRSEAQRSQLDAILRETEDGVIVVDSNDRLILMNPTAGAAFGLDGSDYSGQPLPTVLPHPDVQRLLAAPVGGEGGSRRAEISLGDGRVFNAHLTPIKGVGRAVVMQDITHLKELDRIKSEFVTTVSHDLRSPLTAILGYVELILRTGPVNERQAEFIRRIDASVHSITNLITDLLDLGRIEAGFDTLLETTSFADLVRAAAAELLPHAQAKRQTLSVDAPIGEEEASRLSVHGNPVRLRQMITNLLDNAVKYTPEAGRIEVTARAAEEQVILTVKDSGIGIAPTDQPHIFDKFYRARGVPEDVPGTGLGLSIVRSIVEKHGGRIWVESKVGQGTTFTVVLPRHAGRSRPFASATTAAPAPRR